MCRVWHQPDCGGLLSGRIDIVTATNVCDSRKKIKMQIRSILGARNAGASLMMKSRHFAPDTIMNQKFESTAPRGMMI